jgi:hypothetical protein
MKKRSWIVRSVYRALEKSNGNFALFVTCIITHFSLGRDSCSSEWVIQSIGYSMRYR